MPDQETLHNELLSMFAYVMKEMKTPKSSQYILGGHSVTLKTFVVTEKNELMQRIKNRKLSCRYMFVEMNDGKRNEVIGYIENDRFVPINSMRYMSTARIRT